MLSIISRSSGRPRASSAFRPPVAKTATADRSFASVAAELRSKRNQAPLDSRAISLKACLGDAVPALLEDEDRHAMQAEIAGLVGEIVEAVPPSRRRYRPAHRPLPPPSASAHGQHLADLGVAAAAGDADHQPLQRGRVADEFRRLAFAKPAKIDELDAQAIRPCRPRRTSRPAACRPGPRSAGGSSLRRARGSAGPAGRSRRRDGLRLAQESVDLAGAGPLLAGRFGAFAGTGVFLSLMDEKMWRCRAACKPGRWPLESP